MADSFGAKLEANRALVEEHLRVEGLQQMDALLDTFGKSPFFQLNSQRSTGRDGIRTVYSGMFAGFPDIQTTVKNWYVGPDSVVIETILSGTHKAAWNGIPPTGRHVAVPMCAIFPIDADGKLQAEIVYFDSAILLQQLGLATSGGA
jgi:steroid delta-isomerase-like uncharacterized protein